MTAYAVATFTVEDGSWAREYVKAVGPIVAKHGGRYLARTGDHRVVEGPVSPLRVVIIEFPSLAAAESFYEDSDYVPYRDERIAGTSDDSVFLLVPAE